jgi:endonuclease YncB( thermonuclease family)
MHYIHPAPFSEVTRFAMLDAITVVGGITFVALAIRQAWRRFVWRLPVSEAALQGARRSGRAKWPHPPSPKQGLARQIFLFVAAIAGMIATGAIAYFALAQNRVILAHRVIEGPVRVIDGDTIVVAGVHVRLNGVDAEEVAHPGYPVADPYGEAARAVMQEIVGIGSPAKCDLNGEKSYDRVVGVCFNGLGQDVGAEIIRRGAALDCAHYSGGRYRPLEPPGARARLKQASYC